MANRYVYQSKEGIEDCMRWAGHTEEEIKERLINFIPNFYDRVDKVFISVEEYNKRNSI